MELTQLKEDFAVCKLASLDQVNLNRPFTFLSRTDEEISLVCPTQTLPGNTTHVDQGWKGLRIAGCLEFSMIGIIAKLSSLLAEHNISIFVVSTYNTDYIFLKSGSYDDAIRILTGHDYQIL